MISANSFWMRFAEVPSAFEILGFGFDSFTAGTLVLLLSDRCGVVAVPASVLLLVVVVLLVVAAAAVAEEAAPLGGRPRGLPVPVAVVDGGAGDGVAAAAVAAVLPDPPALEDIFSFQIKVGWNEDGFW